MPDLTRDDIDSAYKYLYEGVSGVTKEDIDDTYKYLYGDLSYSNDKKAKPSMDLETAKDVYANDFLHSLVPLPTRPAAAYITSKITGEPYDTVRQKMAQRVQEAQDVVSKEDPTYDIALSTAKGVGEPATQIAATLGASRLLAPLAKTAPVQKAAKAVSKVPGVKPVASALSSRNPYVRAGSWGGAGFGGSLAANLAAGEDIGPALAKAAATGGDIAAYTIGSTKLPSKYVIPAGMAYEAATGGIGRAMRSEKVLSLPEVAKDLSTGAIKSKVFAGSKISESEPVEGAQVVKNAKLYVAGNPQKPFTAAKEVSKAYKPELGHKYLKDVPTQTNIQNLKRFKKTVPADVRESAPYYKGKVEEFSQKVKDAVTAEAKNNLTEDLLKQQEELTANISKAESLLEKEQVPVANIKKVFGKDTRKVLNYYSAARGDDTFTTAHLSDKKGTLEAPYLLGARSQASFKSTQKYHPLSAKLRDKMYDVFENQEAASLLKDSNKQLSRVYEALDASKEASSVAKSLSDPAAVAKAYSAPGAMRDTYASVLQNINNGQPVVDTAGLKTHGTGLFSKKTQDLINQYNYYTEMSNIAGSAAPMSSAPSVAGLDMQGRLVAAPILDPEFAAYMSAKEAAKTLSKFSASKAEQAAYKFMNNTMVPRAIKAIDPEKGNVFKHSKSPVFTRTAPLYEAVETVEKLPKRKKKEENK